MARFRLTVAASEDLRAISKYTVGQWGHGQAIRYLETLEENLRALADRPRVGRPRTELAPGLRSFPVESHVVFYLEEDQVITVVRLLHRAQDAERYLAE